MSAPQRVPIAILGSGQGTNFEAILAAMLEGRLCADIRCVVSDRPRAPILAKAQAAGIPALSIPPPPLARGSNPDEGAAEIRRMLHERELLRQLAPFQPRFLVLAGYMRLLTSVLLDSFKDPAGFCRIVNVHPSLLPAFPGVDSYLQAFDARVSKTGVTVHLVDEGVDTGPICAQEPFSIEGLTSVAEVRARGFAIEHRLYPATLDWILADNFEVTPALSPEGGKIIVRKN